MTELVRALMQGGAVHGVADLRAFAAAVLLFLALPGPGTFALLASTGHGGLRAGAGATLGIIAGDQVLLWMAVAGVAAVLAAYPAVFEAVRWAGAAYLAWIGWRLLRPGRDGVAAPVRIAPAHYARQAFLITLLNPKAIVFYMAFLPLFFERGRAAGLDTFALMAGTVATITAVYCLALCASAQQVAGWVRRHGRLGRVLEGTAGLFLIVFAWRLLRD